MSQLSFEGQFVLCFSSVYPEGIKRSLGSFPPKASVFGGATTKIPRRILREPVSGMESMSKNRVSDEPTFKRKVAFIKNSQQKSLWFILWFLSFETRVSSFFVCDPSILLFAEILYILQILVPFYQKTSGIFLI